MKTKSCKAKGRRLQNQIAADVLALVKTIDSSLDESDVHPVIMGVSGKDILFSSRAKAVLNLVIEAKNQEQLVVTTTFLKHCAKYEQDLGLKLLVHRRNNTITLVTMKWSDLVALLETCLLHRNLL